MTVDPVQSRQSLGDDILTLLDENRIMSLATLRPDGWPQATMVGYVHDGFSLYFSVAATSQKLGNIRRDPRVSIAVGRDEPRSIRGLSMAAKVAEVTEADEIARLNRTLRARYPEHMVFAPREASAVILRATPSVVSIINLSKGPGHPQLVVLEPQVIVRPVEATAPPEAQDDGRSPIGG